MGCLGYRKNHAVTPSWTLAGCETWLPGARVSCRGLRTLSHPKSTYPHQPPHPLRQILRIQSICICFKLTKQVKLTTRRRAVHKGHCGIIVPSLEYATFDNPGGITLLLRLERRSCSKERLDLHFGEALFLTFRDIAAMICCEL